eukprot:1177249-Prorocentrum_minimum.AAC.1
MASLVVQKNLGMNRTSHYHPSFWKASAVVFLALSYLNVTQSRLFLVIRSGAVCVRCSPNFYPNASDANYCIAVRLETSDVALET